MKNWLRKLFRSRPRLSKSLGENEFEDWTLRSFQELQEIYNVSAIASAQAAVDQPDTDSKVLDDFHQTVQRRFDQMVFSRRDEVTRQLAALDVDLTKIATEKDEALRIHDECKGKVDAFLSTAKSKIAAAKAQESGQRTALSLFKQENRINSPAKVTISTGLFIAILVVVLLAESLINGAFFGNLVRGGIAEGVVIALGISAINVAAGVFLGGPLRNINSIFVSRKILGALSLLIWLLFAISFNLFVGHVRDGIEAFGLEEGLRQAIPTVQDMPFTLESAMSWFLFLLGIIFSLIALIDKYASDDPYPEYGKKSRALEMFEEHLHALREQANTQQDQIKASYIQTGDELVKSAAVDLRNHKQTMTFLRDRIRKQFPEYCEYYKKSLKSLIDSYRETNRKLRQTDPPAYFSEEPDLSWSVFDAAGEMEDLDGKFKRIEKSVEDLQKRWPKLRSGIMNLGETM